MQLVWNVVVMKVFYAFCIPVHREESITKKDKIITIAQLEMVFRATVLLVVHKNQSIHVIFGAPHLAEPGLMAGRRQVLDEIFGNHVF